MNGETGHRCRDGESGPPEPDRLADPLGCIHDANLQEREVCAMLDRIGAAGTPDREVAAGALRFLRAELPLHAEDEEQDLLPLVRRRCGVEDEIDKAIHRLRTEYRRAEADLPEVIAILERLRDGSAGPTAGECAILRRHAAAARRHLTLENAIILPFARLRLTADDLTTLRLRMAQRRGLGRPAGGADAG